MKSVTIAGRAKPLPGRLHGRGEVCVRGGLRETPASELRKQSCRKSTYWASPAPSWARSEEHTSELQSLMRISYAVFCLNKKKEHCTSTTHLPPHTLLRIDNNTNYMTK